MVRWLYDSEGDPIAFIADDRVFTKIGDFVGILYPDQQIWNGDYIGEIYADDRWFFNETNLHCARSLPKTPGLPPFAGAPAFRGPLTPPMGYRDVDFG